jgi:EpsI family protein
MHPPQLWVALILMGVTLALAHGVEFREKVAVNKPFHLFPREVGQWAGKYQHLEQSIIDELDFSDYMILDYVNPEEQSVNFYTAYYETQNKGASIHSPETCLPGGGWTFEQFGKKEVQMGSLFRSITVNRALMQLGGQRQIVYYWFPCRGRNLINAYQLKFYTFWDALIRQRTDGALVRVITPLYPNEKLFEAENRLEGFVHEIVPLLDEFLPK